MRRTRDGSVGTDVNGGSPYLAVAPSITHLIESHALADAVSVWRPWPAGGSAAASAAEILDGLVQVPEASWESSRWRLSESVAASTAKAGTARIRGVVCASGPGTRSATVRSSGLSRIGERDLDTSGCGCPNRRGQARGLTTSYLHTLVQVCAWPRHAPAYARMVEAEHVRCGLQRAAERLVQTVHDVPSAPRPDGAGRGRRTRRGRGRRCELLPSARRRPAPHPRTGTSHRARPHRGHEIHSIATLRNL